MRKPSLRGRNADLGVRGTSGDSHRWSPTALMGEAMMTRRSMVWPSCLDASASQQRRRRRTGGRSCQPCRKISTAAPWRGTSRTARSVVDRGDLVAATSSGDLVDLLLRAGGSLGGEAAGDQVVAGVASLDLDDLAGVAEVGDVVGGQFVVAISAVSLPLSAADRE